MNARCFIIWFFCILLLVFAGCDRYNYPAPKPIDPGMYPCTIAGSVTDTDNVPLAGIEISVAVSADYADVVYSPLGEGCCSDAHGRYLYKTTIYGPQIYSVRMIASDPNGVYRTDTVYGYMDFGDEGDWPSTGFGWNFVLSPL